MAEMLTAKEMQTLLQVDRSTIYRMAEAKKLPAVKIGRQWRFPADEVTQWLQRDTKIPQPVVATNPLPIEGETDLRTLLPLPCVQLMQDTFAEALGTMVVITTMDGQPITEISNPCGLYDVVHQIPNGLQQCMAGWSGWSQQLSLEPQLWGGHLGLLGSRAFIRVRDSLQGMVVIGGIAPEMWPPTPVAIAEMATEFDVSLEAITLHLDQVFYLDAAQRTLVLSLVQRIADVVSHIANERAILTQKLNTIAQVVTI